MTVITKINRFVMAITILNLHILCIYVCLAGKSSIYVTINSGKIL